MSDFKPFSCVNGQMDEPVSSLDRGLAYGDGLFETMRLERGQLPFWCFHYQRLRRDCGRLQLALDFDLLQRYLEELIDLARDRGAIKGVIKLIVTRGKAGRGYQPSLDNKPTVVLSVFPFPSYPHHFIEQGVKVYVCKHRLPDNPALAGIKHLNKLDHVLAALEWRGSSCQEALLLDQHDHLVEASTRNIFVVKNDSLLTPSLQKAGVAGILRRRIMEDYAESHGLIVMESALSLEDLKTADEIFLTNSVLGIWPVKSVASSELEEFSIPQITVGQQMHRCYENDIQARVNRRAT